MLQAFLGSNFVGKTKNVQDKYDLYFNIYTQLCKLNIILTTHVMVITIIDKPLDQTSIDPTIKTMFLILKLLHDVIDHKFKIILLHFKKKSKHGEIIYKIVNY